MVEFLRGVCPVLAVPFADDGALDLDGFASIVDHVLGQDVASVLLFGFAGEFAKLDDAERGLLLDVLVSHAEDRGVAAIASVTDHSADVAVRRAQSYAAAGADALNVLPPSFLSPTAAQVVDHVAAVCDAVDLPIVLQHAPAQTGAVLSAEDIVALASAHPNLTAVKVESHPSGRLVQRLLELSGGELTSLVGYAGLQWPDAHVRGAVGVQPGCSASEVYIEMQRLLDAGSVDVFRELHQRALPWLTYWMQSVELLVSVEKLILQRRGIIASARCRRPTYALDRLESAAVDAFLVEFDELLR